MINNEEFVKRIVEVVRNGTISDSVEDLIDPPGRRPSREDLELSSWYNQLDEKSRGHLLKIISRSVDTTLFGFLAVLDGVRAIEDGCGKGRLELHYKSNEGICLLNDPKKEYLHDIFNQLTMK